MGDDHDRIAIAYGEMVLADRNFLKSIVHVEDRIVVQREWKDAAWKEKPRSRGSILVAGTPYNARMQS